MPLYRFEIEVTEPPDAVVTRLQAVTRERQGFLETLRDAFSSPNETGKVFVGTVGTSSFRIKRDINYRNSFVPLISGLVVPLTKGAKISITMFLHPLVTVFMVTWLSIAGFFVWNAFNLNNPTEIYFSVGMFLFGILLLAGGFIPEAIKAKRFLYTYFRGTAPNLALNPGAQKRRAG